jgi:outer membrane lipopolysaccharide assembly protein LptE/RlpB
MSIRLQKNQPFLHLLARSSAKRRKSLLQQATKDELTALFEICLNILRGHLPLTPQLHKKLKKEQKTLRTFADKKISLKHKKKLVNQKGGFLGALAGIALPLLAQLL